MLDINWKFIRENILKWTQAKQAFCKWRTQIKCSGSKIAILPESFNSKLIQEEVRENVFSRKCTPTGYSIPNGQSWKCTLEHHYSNWAGYICINMYILKIYM